MIGYVIRKYFRGQKNNYKAVAIIIVGIIFEIKMAYCRYCQGMARIEDADLKYMLLEPYCPLPVCASICIFIGFSMLEIKGNFKKLAGITFEIYLFHAIIWDIVCQFITIEMDSRIVIPVSIVLVFLLSIVFSIIYRKVWNTIDNKWNISYKMLRTIGIE